MLFSTSACASRNVTSLGECRPGHALPLALPRARLVQEALKRLCHAFGEKAASVSVVVVAAGVVLQANPLVVDEVHVGDAAALEKVRGGLREGAGLRTHSALQHGRGLEDQDELGDAGLLDQLGDARYEALLEGDRRTRYELLTGIHDCLLPHGERAHAETPLDQVAELVAPGQLDAEGNGGFVAQVVERGQAPTA